ncbi:MAG: amidase [Deltaproteobacteria bacterium]|nr:amidase [Deltaproteobacteria bacterium]
MTQPTRRDLFAGAVIAGAAAACGSRGEPQPREGVPPPAPGPPVAKVEALPAPDVEEATIAQLLERLARGAETSVGLVDKYRQRIDATNEHGPKLRAVLELNPDAAKDAEAADKARAGKQPLGRLHGIPILVKDNIDTAGAMATTAGSLALEGSRAAADATTVARLRKAGAIILGKTNLSEWANFRGASSSSGWSARGGQTRNPYALDRSPSGSSSGSGAATAASLCAASLGTETDGSIVSPASVSGLVGVKPTVGLVSRAGVIPLSTSQDTVGPMARTVADAALILTVIAGADPADPSTMAAHPRRPAADVDYTAALDPKALAGARLGVPRAGWFGKNRNVDAVMTAALAKLAELGAVLVDPIELDIPPELGGHELEVFFTEMKIHLTAYLAKRPDAKARSLDEAIAFNTKHADKELALFGQELFELAAKKTTLEDQAYLAARAKCVEVARTQLLDKAMAEHKLDAIVAATQGPAWMIDHACGDGGGSISSSQLPAVAGYPHVTVPAGHVAGLPIGLSFFGAPFAEAKLLGYAYAFEQATHHRKPPRYRPTAELA